MVLDKEGFNRWAAQYDQTVAQTQADSQYPFAGYDTVLQAIETIRIAFSGNHCRLLPELWFYH